MPRPILYRSKSTPNSSTLPKIKKKNSYFQLINEEIPFSPVDQAVCDVENGNLEKAQRKRSNNMFRRFSQSRKASIDPELGSLQELEGMESEVVNVLVPRGTYTGVQLMKFKKDIIFSYVVTDLPFAMAAIGFGDVLLSVQGCELCNKSLTTAAKFIERQLGSVLAVEVLHRKFELTVTAVLDGLNLLLSDTSDQPLGIVPYAEVSKTRKIGAYCIISIDDVNLLQVEKDDFARRLLHDHTTPKKLRLMRKEVMSNLMKVWLSFKRFTSLNLDGTSNPIV